VDMWKYRATTMAGSDLPMNLQKVYSMACAGMRCLLFK
jgi:hypothetical protein